jgi:type IV secretory pathway ATPase VirB11/archaellum biosynthesis ATPase
LGTEPVFFGWFEQAEAADPAAEEVAPHRLRLAWLSPSWVSLGSSSDINFTVIHGGGGGGDCDAVEEKLVDEVRKNGTLIVVGETGSGKTTRKCVAMFLFLPLLIIVWME